jgi:hypothetical protein
MRQQRVMLILPLKPGAATTADDKATEMEWEEALLRAWGGERLLQPATHYRRNAARARKTAEGVTTRAMKARLLMSAVQFEQLAAEADREAREPSGLYTQRLKNR